MTLALTSSMVSPIDLSHGPTSAFMDVCEMQPLMIVTVKPYEEMTKVCVLRRQYELAMLEIDLKMILAIVPTMMSPCRSAPCFPVMQNPKLARHHRRHHMLKVIMNEPFLTHAYSDPHFS